MKRQNQQTKTNEEEIRDLKAKLKIAWRGIEFVSDPYFFKIRMKPIRKIERRLKKLGAEV